MSGRVRASLLLRLVTLVLSVGLFLALLRLALSSGLTVAAAVALVAVWFIGIEMGLLPYVIQRAVLRRAGDEGSAAGEATSSIWFVEAQATRRRDQDELEKTSRQNPTIR